MKYSISRRLLILINLETFPVVNDCLSYFLINNGSSSIHKKERNKKRYWLIVSQVELRMQIIKIYIHVSLLEKYPSKICRITRELLQRSAFGNPFSFSNVATKFLLRSLLFFPIQKRFLRKETISLSLEQINIEARARDSTKANFTPRWKSRIK